MTFLSRYGLAVSLFWKPVRDVLQRWRICLASLVFFTIFLTNNFGLSTASNGFQRQSGLTWTLQTETLVEVNQEETTPPVDYTTHGSTMKYVLYNNVYSRTSPSSVSRSSHVDDVHIDKDIYHIHQEHSASNLQGDSKDYGKIEHHQRSTESSSTLLSSMPPAISSSVNNIKAIDVVEYISPSSDSSTHVDNRYVNSKSSELFEGVSNPVLGNVQDSPQSSVLLPRSTDKSLVSSPKSTTTPALSHSQQSMTTEHDTVWPRSSQDTSLSSLLNISKTTVKPNSKLHSQMSGKIAEKPTDLPVESVASKNKRHIDTPHKKHKMMATSSLDTNKERFRRLTDSSTLISKAQQCLVLTNNTAFNVCSKNAEYTECQRTQNMRKLHLKFCGAFQVYTAIPHHDKKCWLEHKSQVECEHELSKVINQDELARSMYTNMKIIFNRFDCNDSFSVRWTCADCQDTYKNWLCSRFVPYYEGQQALPPCPKYCEMVETRCPYFKPHLLDTYAGEPTFICRDWNDNDIPHEYLDAAVSAQRMNDSSPSTLVRCHLPCANSDSYTSSNTTAICATDMDGSFLENNFTELFMTANIQDTPHSKTSSFVASPSSISSSDIAAASEEGKLIKDVSEEHIPVVTLTSGTTPTKHKTTYWLYAYVALAHTLFVWCIRTSVPALYRVIGLT